MSRADRLIVKLSKRLNQIDIELSEMRNNVGILTKPNDPDAYRRWYLASMSTKNLEGFVGACLDEITDYRDYKALPWWKKIFRRKR